MNEYILLENFEEDFYKLCIVDMTGADESNNICSGKFVRKITIPLKNPSDSEIKSLFDSLASQIEADNLFVDLHNKYRSSCLNTWSIKAIPNAENIFTDIKPLSYDDKIRLYTKQHSITKEYNVIPSPFSLNFLIECARCDVWKNGVLQRCIDLLVKPQHQKDPKVYALIDECYRQALRFKLEVDKPILDDNIITKYIRSLVKSLGLSNSRDPTPFCNITERSISIINLISNNFPGFELTNYDGYFSKLDRIFNLWTGSRLIKSEDRYSLHPNNNIETCLSYLKEKQFVFGQM